MSNKDTEEVRLLRAYKRKTGLSFSKLANAIGVHPGTVYDWFQRNQNPSDMAKRLIRGFLEKAEKDGMNDCSLSS